MKKDSDELFQLITALTPAEKRYCSLYLKKNASGDDNRYLALFNYLKDAGEYDAAKIMKQLRYEKRPNHYAVLKKQLYEQLLDALHQFSAFSNPGQQLMQGISQCNLLLQKNLVAQCEKKITTLPKTAVAMDHSVAQLLLQNLKLAVMSKKRFRQISDADLANWEKETLEVNKDLESYSRYAYLNASVAKMNYESSARSAQLTARIKAVIDLPEFSHEKKTRTVHSKELFYQTQAQYHFQSGETQKSMDYLQKNLQLLENNPQTNLFVKSYQTVLYNYLLTCLELKKYALFETNLEKLRNIPNLPAFKRLGKSPQDPMLFCMSYTLEMDYLISIANFKQAHLKVAEIRNGFQQYGEKIPKRNRIILHTMMAYVCFAVAKFDEALENVMPVIQEKENAVAEDMQLVARMIQLLGHFEKGDKILTDSLIKSLQRTLRDKDASGDVLRTVLSFIHTSLRLNKIEKKKWVELQKN